MIENEEENDIHNQQKKKIVKVVASISDLNPSRSICIVTTASVPWRTGTSINPLARALYLCKQQHKKVSLYIPWLDKEDQQILFGNNIQFDNETQQILWIKQYCKDRIHCEEEAEKLNIRFYPSFYNHSFGSIFPKVDICSLIPDEDADVAILEEPEHLNWFRYVPQPLPSSSSSSNEHDNTTTNTNTSNSSSNNEKQQQQHDNDDDDDDEANNMEEEDEIILGWKQKFNFVIGIIHTNYSAYLNQYSIGPGTAFVTSTALTALSSLVVKAYCHRIIRLSDTLPTLDENIEVTCNVHGVRSEFLQQQQQPKEEEGHNGNDDDNKLLFSSIYFIGKLTWAKGFDKCLELQDLYRKKTGKFFDIDIYGSGNDADAIKRSFFGRPGLLLNNNNNNDDNNNNNDEKKENCDNSSSRRRSTAADNSIIQQKDEIASLVFSETSSLKHLLIGSQNQNNNQSDDYHYYASRSGIDDLPDLFSVLGDAGGRTLYAGVETTEASKRLGGKLLDIGFHAAFLEEEVTETTTTTATLATTTTTTNDGSSSSNGGEKTKKYHFSPVQTKFELRREAIPARFLGVKDHAALRDITAHKIFLNMSETEVLCTTTAEALAMGKFVIIPIHPSNEFFLQFSNCLGFTSQEECVEKIQWALENEPKPLSKDEAHTLSWEGAVERLIECSAVTEDFLQQQVDSGEEESSRQAAKIHVEAMRKGHAAMKLLNRSS